MKAHTVLVDYANQKDLKPAQITFHFKYKVAKSAGLRRLKEVADLKQKMKAERYPYMNCMKFSLVEEA